jgi:hypothetical protein
MLDRRLCIRRITPAATKLFKALAADAKAEIQSKSKDLVVMEARNLPQQAQIPGNSLLLH